MNSEYISLETARELHILREKIKKTIKYIEKPDVALGSYDKMQLLKILRGDNNGFKTNTNSRISKNSY